MNTITLYKNKEQLIRFILDANEDTISEIIAILEKSVKYPAQMTIEELKKEVMQSYKDAKKGKGKPMEQLFKEVEQW